MQQGGLGWETARTDKRSLWTLVALHRAKGILSVASQRMQPEAAACQLACLHGLAEKHSSNHTSISLKVLLDLILFLYSAYRKGSSWWFDNPRKNVFVLTVNELNW